MRDEWYDEYAMRPFYENHVFDVAIKFLQTLDRFGVVEVRPGYQGRPYDVVNICIDDVCYDEEINCFVKRFKGRSD